MRRIKDPRQTLLFDPYADQFSTKARKRLDTSWPGLFRQVILELMPVEELSENFSARMGAPTKEQYSMAGLLIIKEFMDWTVPETANAYLYHMDVQYALNLETVCQDLSERTIERYQKIFIENDLSAEVMHRITTCLSEKLEINVSKQRLDSTHIFSNMAIFGRTRLMGVVIKRFLAQVKRQDLESYASLDEKIRDRYAPSKYHMFGEALKDIKSRNRLRQEVAEELHFLLNHFEPKGDWSQKQTFKDMKKVFFEQCEVEIDKVVIKEKPGGKITQNPSDPDATYDGHKGPGYQVQISETCAADNEVQLIVSAIPQTAFESDSDSIDLVIEDLKHNKAVPEELLADTAYCSDENVEKCKEEGVHLLGPVPGKDPDALKEDSLSIDDFVVDETTETIIRCPAGYEVEASEHDQQTGNTTTYMNARHCSSCSFVNHCPIQKAHQKYKLIHTAKQRRLAARRCEEKTDVFKEFYRVRSGIEGLNGCLKIKMGLDRLRVRGKPRVFNAIVLKLAGWNILRAASSTKMQKIVAEKMKLANPSTFLDLMKQLYNFFTGKRRLTTIHFEISSILLYF